MGRNLGLIIFLLFVAWQVVTAIINQVNANKQQQRAEEMAKRKHEAGVTGKDGGGGQSRIDDLAARRKAQLEELRKRREAGKTAPASTQARVGGPSTASPNDTRILDPTARRQQPIRIEPATRERKPDPWQARQEAMRSEREAQKARQAEQSRAAQLRQRQAARERAEAQAAVPARRRGAAAITEPVAELQPAEPTSIRRRIHNPQELRELFVLKELLDPPISLRNEQG